MKVGFKQVAASVIGAVLAALALSFFGVKGTIIGVAIGSAAASLGSAISFNSLEKGHEKVKEIVTPISAKWPGADVDLTQPPSIDATPLGLPTTEVRLDDPWARPSTDDGWLSRGEPTEVVPAPAGVSEVTQSVPLDHGGPTSTPAIPVPTIMGAAPLPPKGVRWPVIAVIALVFAIALGAVTLIELAVGKPLSSVVHGTPAPKNSTSVGGVVSGGGSSPPTTSSTTTTRPPTTTTTHPTTTSTSTTSTTTSSTTTTSSPTPTTSPVIPTTS